MKVFLSYGHNDYTKLVDAVFDALIEAGHEPWKDDRYEGISGIPAGEDFTKVIYDAIDDCDFVLAFVTAQTANKPYCCDERQYAYNHKGKHFIQLRLDGTPIRLGNSLSHVDMDDAVLPNGEINREILNQTMQSVFAAMKDPDSFMSGGSDYWAKFEAHLKVTGAVPYSELLSGRDSDGFVGREWLKEQCIRWANDSSVACRLFVILGEAGTGKTAFVRHLAGDRELVRSVHVCRYDRPATRTVTETIKDLSYILAQNNQRYFEYLKNKPFDELKEMTPDALFEFLILEPLRDESEKYLLIIDGLDELNEATDFRSLMSIFREYAHKINPNISILATGRPDAEILSALGTISGREEPVTLDKALNEDDLEEYIRQQLSERGEYTPELAGRILTACDGNFEYLSQLFKEANDEGLSLADAGALPRGLKSRYTQYLERRMVKAGQGNKLTKNQRILLGVMAAAEEPVTKAFLEKITGIDEDDITDELGVFGSLIRREDVGKVSFFAKSFRDYLLDPPEGADEYRIRREKGDKAIAGYIMKRCDTAAKFSKEPYFPRRGMLHILRCAVIYKDDMEDDIKEYLVSLEKSGSDSFYTALAEALNDGDEAVLRAYCRFVCFIDPYCVMIDSYTRLNRDHFLARLAEIFEDEGQKEVSLLINGELNYTFLSPEKLKKAETFYNEAYELTVKNRYCEPVSHNRGPLRIIYTRLGRIAVDKRTKEGRKETIDWYKRALPLNELFYSEHPNSYSHDTLRNNYIALGYACFRAIGYYADAVTVNCYKKALELDEQLYNCKPDYSSRKNIIEDYFNFANLYIFVDNKQAEKYCLKALELAEEIYNEDGSSYYLIEVYKMLADLARQRRGYNEAESWLLKALKLADEGYIGEYVVDIYNKLADLAKRKLTPEGNNEAELWYLKALKLADEDYIGEYRVDIYNNLADLAKRKRTPEGNNEAESWYLKALQLTEEDYAEKPTLFGYDLCKAYENLANLASNRHTPESNKKAEEWYKKALELAEKNYTEKPDSINCKVTGRIYEALARLAREKHTPEGDKEAEEWLKKEIAFFEQFCSDYPSCDSREALSDVYLKSGDFARENHSAEGDIEAEARYKKALKLAEQNYCENPNSYSSRMIRVYERLAGLAGGKQTPEGDIEAEAWYLKALDLAKQNHTEKPDHFSYRRLHEALARLAREKHTPEGDKEAEEWLKKEIAFFEQLCSDYPSCDSREALSDVYLKSGDFARENHSAEGDIEAEARYKKALKLAEQNYCENPNSYSSRMIRVYERLAGLAGGKQTPEGDIEAETWYIKALELAEQNYSKNPRPLKRSRLLHIYCALADLAKRKHTPEGDIEADNCYLKALELAEQNYSERPVLRTRGELSSIYEKLAAFARAKHTPEGDKEAEEWDEKLRKLKEENT